MYILNYLTFLKKVVKYNGIGGTFKTIMFNFRYFPLYLAWKLPVTMTSKVKVRNMHRGGIVLKNCGGWGILCLGGIDKEYCYDHDSVINIVGTLVLDGSGWRCFAPGAIIYVGDGATLTIGKDFSSSHDLKIYCRHKITIGNDNMWSYYNVVMDNDGHYIYDETGNHINSNSEVIFGNHVWMGCRCTVLKGSIIPDGSIVGSNSQVREKLTCRNAIYAGNGPVVIKENISWDRNLI